MAARLLVLSLSAFFFAVCEHIHAETKSDRYVAITNVTLIDVVSGEKRSAMSILVEGGRIEAVAERVAIPEGAIRVDGSGKFVIPGFWDMHAHHQVTGADSLDLFLANGVVGTRDMGADLEFILSLRERISRGELLGPEIVAAGPILDDRPLDWPLRRRITNAEEAREAVRDLKKRGVDFIKVHDSTPRDAYFAIADEASKLGLVFAGHVPLDITMEEAAESGMKSIEHLSNFRVFRDVSGKKLYDPIACRPLFQKLAAKGVWQTPTLTFFLAIPDLFSGKPLRHVEYASDSLLEFTRKNAETSRFTERQFESFRVVGRASFPAIRDLHASGSRFLAGSDGLVPGFSIHDELEWFVKAGLSPLSAIQTATINPAIFLEREKVQGTIEPGKIADLILLDADPLLDINNTRRIAAVLVGGRLLAKRDLEQILSTRRRSPPGD